MALSERLRAPLSKLLPTPRRAGPRNVLRDGWDLLSSVPGGKFVFSRLVGRMAPYSGSIGALITALRPGYAEVQMQDRRSVRNHLDCIHAIAVANLAELAGNIALAYSLPDDARFIVSGLSIEYVKKARGVITASANCPVPDSNARVELDVPVEMRDAKGDVVARAVLKSLVGPKKG